MKWLAAGAIAAGFLLVSAFDYQEARQRECVSRQTTYNAKEDTCNATTPQDRPSR